MLYNTCMAKVLVKANVFQFYLDSYGLKAEELAKKSSIPDTKIKLWATSDSEIPVGKLRDMANVYKKHWGIFLLKEPTSHFKKPRDFRARSSRQQLGLISKLAFEEASRLIYLNHTYRHKTLSQRFVDMSSAVLSSELLAEKARSLLGVNEMLQFSWKNPEAAWNYYSTKLEENGFIVSVQELDDNVDGFIVTEQDGAAIIINSKVHNTYRKTFTLLHELGHYFQKQSALCDTSEPIHEVQSENYADDFASKLLVPASLLSTNKTVQAIANGKAITNADYAQLSKQFCISMSQVVVRLHELKLISDNERDKQLSIAEKLYRESETKRKKKLKDSKGFDPKGHERRAINRMSVPLASTLLSNYVSDKITARDFSSLMGVKVNLVGRIVDMLNERT